jgi:hypothetical protein
VTPFGFGGCLLLAGIGIPNAPKAIKDIKIRKNIILLEGFAPNLKKIIDTKK